MNVEVEDLDVVHSGDVRQDILALGEGAVARLAAELGLATPAVRWFRAPRAVRGLAAPPGAIYLRADLRDEALLRTAGHECLHLWQRAHGRLPYDEAEAEGFAAQWTDYLARGQAGQPAPTPAGTTRSGPLGRRRSPPASDPAGRLTFLWWARGELLDYLRDFGGDVAEAARAYRGLGLIAQRHEELQHLAAAAAPAPLQDHPAEARRRLEHEALLWRMCR